MDISFIQDIVAKRALLGVPFPVGAFDIGSHGVALVFHNGITELDDGDDDDIGGYDSGVDNDHSRDDEDSGPEYYLSFSYLLRQRSCLCSTWPPPPYSILERITGVVIDRHPGSIALRG